MSQQSISNWYHLKALRPLLGLITFSVLFCGGFIWFWVQNQQTQEQVKIEEYQNLFATAIHNKNMSWAESLLVLSKASMTASSAALCKNDETILVSGADNLFCSQSASGYFAERVSIDLPGYEGQSVLLEISLIKKHQFLIWVIAFSILFLSALVSLIYILRKRLNDDLVLPLQEGLLHQKQIPIQELETLRKSQLDALNAKAHKELFDTLSETLWLVTHSLSSPLSYLNISGFTWKKYLPNDELNSFNNSLKRITSTLDKLGTYKNMNMQFSDAETQLKQLRELLQSDSQEKFSLTSSLATLIEQKRVEYGNCQFDLEFLNDESAEIKIQANRPEFETVVSDIINNGVESYKNDEAKIQVNVATEKNKVLLKIKDFGTGISEDIREQVFEKGFSSGKNGGTGCGLYNAKSWVRQANGDISLKSQVGNGTTVAIELPLGEKL